jgi:GntR family transcriptional regulator of arabinose operon
MLYNNCQKLNKMLYLAYMKKEPLYKGIQKDIENKIADGTYPPGFRLMPENDMTDFYGVSRITVRNAMDHLTRANLVERIRGKGTFVIGKEEGEKKEMHSFKGKKISLIVPNLDDPHTIKMFKGIYGEAEKKDYAITVYQTHHDQGIEEKAISQSLKDNVDGLIIYPVQNEIYNEEIIKLALGRFPAVLIDRSLEGININSVVTENEVSSFTATRHLLEKGHRNIGFISPDLNLALTLKERYRGYVRAHEEMGLDLNGQNLYSYDDDINRMSLQKSAEDHDFSALEKYLRENKSITAFLCAEPQETKLLMLTLKRLKKSVPQDISFIGFDDFDNADLFSPPPTVVRQNSEKMGRTAFSILEELIEGGENERKSIRIEADLIIRESVSVIG